MTAYSKHSLNKITTVIHPCWCIPFQKLVPVSLLP